MNAFSFHHARLVCIGIITTALAAAANAGSPDTFEQTAPHRIQIVIPTEGLRSLRSQARTWVSATWRDADGALGPVGVRVKGRTGSFRPIDDKPSLTIDFDQQLPAQRWHGLRRIHLNNSVEDPSFQHEQLASELFQAAGIPAPRVAQGIVTLNGRLLGLYVIKEGFTTEFLSRHFASADGNLYEPEPGPGCDIDGPMKLNFGSGPTNRADLRELLAAVSEPDPAQRWHRLESVLDRDRFISFLALEFLLGHRDGYAQARNNYRLYHDPATSRFQFLPSGLDQLFGRANSPLLPRCSGRVAQAVVSTDEGRAAVREHLGTLFTNHFQPVDWTQRVNSNAARLYPVLSRSDARALQRASRDLIQRVQNRVEFVGRELAGPGPQPLHFTDRAARLGARTWQPIDPPDNGRMERGMHGGQAALSIVAGPRTSASWRTRVQLVPGRYRFEARIKTRGVTPLPFGKNHGATLAVNGLAPDGTPSLNGDNDWTPVLAEFVARPDPTTSAGTATSGALEVELSCVLRASAGVAWFDLGTLRLVRLE